MHRTFASMSVATELHGFTTNEHHPTSQGYSLFGILMAPWLALIILGCTRSQRVIELSVPSLPEAACSFGINRTSMSWRLESVFWYMPIVLRQTKWLWAIVLPRDMFRYVREWFNNWVFQDLSGISCLVRCLHAIDGECI